MFVCVSSDRCVSEEAACRRPIFIHEREKDRQCAYNVTLRCVRVTIFAVEKQYVLNILIVCMYVYLCMCVCVCVCDIEVRSRNHFCSGKAIRIKYSNCVYVCVFVYVCVCVRARACVYSCLKLSGTQFVSFLRRVKLASPTYQAGPYFSTIIA